VNPRNRKERIVLKQYDSSDPHHRSRFTKEIAVLERLRDCPYAPRLLLVDKPSNTMWISYAGPMAKTDDNVRAQVEHHLREMGERWGVHRVSGGGAQRRTDFASLFPGNICILNGKVILIDYGSPSWQLTPRPISRSISAPA
jgi:hypothetical protein